MSNAIDDEEWERLVRYAAGEGSPGERAALRRWIEERPERAAILDAMRRVGRASDPAGPGWDARAAWDALATRLALPSSGSTTAASRTTPPARTPRENAPARPRVGPFTSRRRTRWSTVGIAAAAAVLLAMAGSFALSRGGHQPSTRAAAGHPWREYATRRGQRATIELLDGTHVDLGVDSRLRVRMPADGPRELSLEGEAVFDVAHDPVRPLTVRAGNALMRDIGTRFDVRAYPNSGTVQVVVASGLVQLSDTADAASSGLLLAAGDLGSIDPGGAKRLSRGVDTTQFFAWTEGHLVFDRTPLHEAAARLERWFDIEIRIPDSTVASRRLTATITAQGVEDVLGAVTLPLHLQYERHGGLVVIERRPAGKATSPGGVTTQTRDGRSR